MSKPDLANFVAARCVAVGEGFLGGRSDAAALARESDTLCLELMLIGDDPAANAIGDPARLLVMAMMRCAIATGPRAVRWRAIVSALIDLVRLESLSMRAEVSPRRWHRQSQGNADILQGARAE
jgi:hypothetical protein